MWKEPEPDPGGNTQGDSSSGKPLRELSDLKDQNEQQQLLIAQLKEMLRKEQSNVTQEKVEEYVNTLSKAKAKKSRMKKEESGSVEKSISSSSSSIDITKKQKLNLLKQQLEENKAKLAERGKNQKGIEEMVTQLKAQLNDSQQLIPSNISMLDLKNLEYSKNSTHEELYNILLTKEKKITDLLSKVQKQEIDILDLEENLKEKDSVIDARTKAITLMTESLSKKGKTTLDALDDTKEQMRKMQENFVTLESEMKARQVKLLNDLKAKNYEITELQETNQRLLEEKLECNKRVGETEELKNSIKNLQQELYEKQAENEANVSKISELEKKLQDSIDDFSRLKNTGLSISTEQNNDEEVTKLKKQLEENNKSMIKIKAQSKSKIKELNKKLDQIKKANDTNELIVQLQNENTKLSEKIAELEEEKGNIQLKMVESSDSIKDSSLTEEQKELENNIAKYLEEIEEKDKIISLLETEIISLKQETKSLNEKVSGLSHFENLEVSAEIKSIQLEEQLEKVENENVKLKEEIEEFLRKKDQMAEQMEELKKEKQEISSKLDNYIQENMDLIDKLEKLSAEKVSSAESIEIVEGLTQQEKLELAAYQKNLDVHIEDVSIKCSEDDHIEPPTELNESVIQLNEDSTELLQKIDMFTMERKEVMTKMEALKDENSLLNMKLKETENNRDILAETYEQIQTEKEVLQNENDSLIKKIQNLEQLASHSEETVKDESDFESVTLAELQDLQNKYEKLIAENKEQQRIIKEYDVHIHEKHNLESDLKKANEKIEELQTTIHNNLEEITNYQSVIEENKNELIDSANVINDLQIKLSAREKDIADLNIIISDLNEVVNNLQLENSKLGNFEFMESQVKELKTALNDQIQQAQEYEEEIARNNDIISDLNTKLIELNKKIIETEHEMEIKDIEYNKLIQDLHDKNETIQNLQRQMQEKDNKVSFVIQDMKEKYLSLQKQLEGNSGSLENKIMELTNKNKEQMERMKKIAANLKKKSQAYQELEERYNEDKEKWETEVNEKKSIISNSQDKMETILHQLKDLEEEVNFKNTKLMECDIKIRELSDTIQNLEQNNVDLQNSLIELKHREQKLTEVSLKQELSTSLHEDFDDVPNNPNSAKEEKIKELELIIETNAADIAHYNDRIYKLEENISHLEQEKETLLRKTMELSDQLNATSRSVQEKSFAEEELGQKLLQVTANDEILMKKLEEVTEEHKELIQKDKELEEINLKLKVKLKKAHERVTQLKSLQTTVEELENANNELKKQVAMLESNQKHIQDENFVLQKQNQNDYEKIEADYQIQLEELVKCRNELTVECEKLRESLKEMEQREEDLLSEVAEYREKMEKNETENKEKLEELADELRVATFNWNDAAKEVDTLKQQVEDLQVELITKIARETIESIVTEAEDRIRSMRSIASQTDAEKIDDIVKSTEIENVAITVNEAVPVPVQIVPTFHWPNSQQLPQTSQAQDLPCNETTNPLNISTSTDWFNRFDHENVQQQQDPFSISSQQPMVIDNSKEELLNKIKTLEFLLYNIDKEKEEAFQECTRMVNELTRLVYEKVNPSNKEISTAPKQELRQPLSEIESQIMSETDVTDTASNKIELQSIEFEKVDKSLGEQSRPVIEELMQPTRAYLTYQPEEKAPGNLKPEVFGENDDGWGWGPEEAKLEEEHQFKTESTPQIQSLRSEITRLNETLQVLQVERENHLEEIKQLQVKSGKLIKKCKELKQKNDQLVEKQQNKKSEGADFLDLDAAIQEELKTQITQLEKKIKEITNELEKEKHEKANIIKRTDVLTSASDKMTEMKEILEAEVLHWKRKYQEIEEKLNQYEWNSDGFNEGSKPKNESSVGSSSDGDNKKIEELQQTIKELSLDNEELQTLLEEQRQLRIDLEKAKIPLEKERLEKDQLSRDEIIQEKETAFNELLLSFQQINFLKEELNIQVTQLLNDLEQQRQKYDEAQIENSKNTSDLQNKLTQQIENFDISKLELVEKINKLQIELGEQKTINDQLQVNATVKINELNHELDELKQKYDQLHLAFIEKTAELTRISEELESKQFETSVNETYKWAEEKHHLESLLAEKEDDSTKLRNQKEELEQQIEQLKNNLKQTQNDYETLLNEEKEEFSNTIKVLEEQIDNLRIELDQKRKVNDQLEINATIKINQLNLQMEALGQKYDQLQNEYAEKTAELNRMTLELQSKQFESVTKDTFEWTQEKYQLETLLAETEAICARLTNEKEELEQQIEQLKNNLEQKQIDYEKLFNETEEKISKAVKELEENWIIQVDQRGANVAESWKLHLETVEAEFASVQEKLKNEINELEERCNALVNENNELRKNVDAEIRNEVDRISALQQQITDCQRYITELNNTLIEKQNENENLIAKLTAIEKDKEELVNNLRDKENKLSSLSIIADTTQKQFDEKREVVEEIVKVLEKNTTFPISFEKEDVLNEFQRQINLLNVKEEEILKLNHLIENLQSRLTSLQDKDGEISRLNQLVQDLQKQLDLLQEKDNEISRLNNLVDDSQKQLVWLHEKDEELLNLNKLVEDLQIQLGPNNEKDNELNRLNNLVRELQGQLSFLREKDEEIVRLNQVIENYKVQQNISQQELDALRQEQVTANMTMEDYKRKLEEFNTAYMMLQNSIDEKSELIATLNQQLQLTEGLKNDNNKDVEELQVEISQIKKDCSMMQQSLAECQEQLFNVTNELTSKTNQLETVNQQLAYSQQNFEIQEGELIKLRELLQYKEQEYNSSVEHLRRTHLRDLESHYEELLAAKDLDIESVRSQLNESIQNSNQLTEKIIAEENLCRQLGDKVKELEEKIAEQSTLQDEEDKQLTEMRSIIEQQVIKIEELKKELFAKSSDYDSLIAEMDIGRKAITQQPIPSAVVETPVTIEKTQPFEEDLSEPVRRAELDLALYMLHQRDVRCEELTVELTQLLEERDTLQLRLSNSLREKEEIRRKMAGSEEVPMASASTSTPVTPLSKSSAIFLAASGTELAKEPLESSSDMQNLQMKLSELRSVGYKKDKTFVDEQEFRRLQQMSIMQQHINEASKLPPEAAAKLVDASYTLSRDVQSPSKVLLNWLWGRSTPKVNDT